MQVQKNDLLLNKLLSTKNPDSSFIVKITIQDEVFKTDEIIQVLNPYTKKPQLGTIRDIVYLGNPNANNKNLYFVVELPKGSRYRTCLNDIVITEIDADYAVVNVVTYVTYCKLHNIKFR
jgi:hypothetical protein